MQPDFVKVTQKSEIPQGTSKAVKVEDKGILVANVNCSFYTVSQKCTQQGRRLIKKPHVGSIVTCPRHHAKFDVTNGKVVSYRKMTLMHPKAKNLETHKVKTENDDILIKP